MPDLKFANRDEAEFWMMVYASCASNGARSPEQMAQCADEAVKLLQERGPVPPPVVRSVPPRELRGT